MLCVGVTAAGCTRTVQAENPLEIGEDEYHAVFDATVRTLRDYRFEVDRQDRRFGVVTTGPLIAASVFEPWHDDNTTAKQVLENTLNHQRRRVRVQLAPAGTLDAAADGAGDEATTVPGEGLNGGDGVYDLFVQVFVERRQHPPRVLNSEVFAGVQLRRRPQLQEPIVTEEGLIESRWRLLGRDHALERRLIAEIIRRSIEIEPIYPPQAEAN